MCTGISLRSTFNFKLLLTGNWSLVIGIGQQSMDEGQQVIIECRIWENPTPGSPEPATWNQEPGTRN